LTYKGGTGKGRILRKTVKQGGLREREIKGIYKTRPGKVAKRKRKAKHKEGGRRTVTGEEKT